MHVEFIVAQRPVSQQARRQERLRAWRELVADSAKRAAGAPAPQLSLGPTAIRILYFYDEAALDTDNVVKPIQDALKGVLIEDDSVVTDIEVRRRWLRTDFTLRDPSPALIEGLELQTEFVYVLVSDAPEQDVLP